MTNLLYVHTSTEKANINWWLKAQYLIWKVFFYYYYLKQKDVDIFPLRISYIALLSSVDSYLHSFKITLMESW